MYVYIHRLLLTPKTQRGWKERDLNLYEYYLQNGSQIHFTRHEISIDPQIHSLHVIYTVIYCADMFHVKWFNATQTVLYAYDIDNRIISYRVVLCRVVSCRVISYHIICYIILHYTTPQQTTLHYIYITVVVVVVVVVNYTVTQYHAGIHVKRKVHDSDQVMQKCKSTWLN